ncbi:MAG: hypothetical protein K9J37_11800 [Saprospiraceae bacterium]|nr:hypothetical protein [Saprospiraceae bacterium]MCF8250591.1 hypothetical protein [Saprospiraceae bacterium]MCF8281407.1 hypothetical protein [Bacteroidales bacterium]MCF8313090.1 hypothetical protein [Saprospiraceae bacterium]MCF8441546.1 hypothetical protein [Saprospiraceae bacterium]
MKFRPTYHHYSGSLKTVVFLAILYFLPIITHAQRAISLTPEKSDALYIGVESPVQVKVEGISPDKVYLASDGIDIQNLGDGLYTVRAEHPGKVTFTVHGEGFDYKNFDLEVKRIPDPMAALKFDNGTLITFGEMTAEEFKKAVGIGFETGGYKGKIQIDITSYNLVRVPKEGDPVEVPNNAADFNKKAQSLINAAAPGDKYYFEEVMADVEGTENLRKMNNLVFQIK